MIRFSYILFFSLLFGAQWARAEGDPDSLKNVAKKEGKGSYIYTGKPDGSLPNSVFYKERYGAANLMDKVTDNKGEGFDSLYGTRNFRPVLHGIAYRGGGNNHLNKFEMRSNKNPLPEGALDNLCREGFEHVVYLYEANYESSPKQKDCDCIRGRENQLSYHQLNFMAPAELRKMIELVYLSYKGESGPVYLHCWNGWHASGFMGAVLLKQFCGYSDQQAVNYWDLGTDGFNTHERYEYIRRKIREFEPFPEFRLLDDEGNGICPPMPEIIDSTLLAPKNAAKAAFMMEEKTVEIPSKKLYLGGLTALEESFALESPQYDTGSFFILENLKFASSSSAIPYLAYDELEWVLDALHKNPFLEIEIHGHTDNTGRPGLNLSLSEKRAQTVEAFYLNNGIDSGRVRSEGYGLEHPRFENDKREGRLKNRRIEIKVVANRNLSPEEIILLEQKKLLQQLHDDPKPILDGSNILLSGLEFKPGKSELMSEEIPSLILILRTLHHHPGMRIQVEGHSDPTGREEKNILLSEERAKRIYDYLVSHGIEAERLTYKGHGSSKPLFDNANKENWNLNRRIEIKLIRKK